MPKVEKTCKVCGKQFAVWPNRAETANTCSIACRSAANAERYKSTRPVKACVICGKEFECPPSHAHKKFCCSLACAHERFRRREVPKMEDHFNWKRGSSVHADGYLLLLVERHPFAANGRYVFEHRLVVEAWMRDKAPDHRFLVEVNGVKYLRSEIEVHHRNENKRDNRFTNLLACTRQAHRAIHRGEPPMEGEVWPPVEGMAPFTPYRVSRTCETCGAEFEVQRGVVARGGGKFCNRTCYVNRPRKAFEAVTA